MIKITILGDSLRAICAAHQILDTYPDAEVCMITDRAEIGLIGEVPGLFSEWPPCPPHWVSDMGSQTPNQSSTAVRGSWFLKALGIQLSKRGCTFHLRTRVTEATEMEVRFVGAGPLGKGSFRTDRLLDIRQTAQNPMQWNGLVCRTSDAPGEQIVGNRSDGTTEVWARASIDPSGISLQEMTWEGDNPSDYIKEEVEMGMQLAQEISLIQ